MKIQKGDERLSMYNEAQKVHDFIKSKNIHASDELLSTLITMEKNSGDSEFPKIKANIPTVIEYNNIKNQFKLDGLIGYVENYYTIGKGHEVLGSFNDKSKDEFINHFEHEFEIIKNDMLPNNINDIRKNIQEISDFLGLDKEDSTTILKKDKQFSIGEKKEMLMKLKNIFNQIAPISPELFQSIPENVIYDSNFMLYLYRGWGTLKSSLDDKISKINRAFITLEGRIFYIKNKKIDASRFFSEINKIGNELKALKDNQNTGGTGYRNFLDTEPYKSTISKN